MHYKGPQGNGDDGGHMNPSHPMAPPDPGAAGTAHDSREMEEPGATNWSPQPTASTFTNPTNPMKALEN